MSREKLTYKKAGVDIERGEEFACWIKEKIASVTSPQVLSEVGSFAGLYSLDKEGYRQPVLAATADGVGTKLRVAQRFNRHDTVGIDVVAMCVNDLLAQGARPLFFLDYISMGSLCLSITKQIISGIIEGCRRAGCSLLGGETAEMPSFYKEGEYDLVGFAVGIMEREEIKDTSKVKPGDRILGLASSGLHSNGFSLVRKVFFEVKKDRLEERIKILGRDLGEELLKPTRIYTRPILYSWENLPLKGIAHISGGGMVRNISRILPSECRARIYQGSWRIHPIFKLIQEEGNIEKEEMFKTFNMGIGMVLIVPAGEENSILKALYRQREEAKVIGEVVKGKRGVEIEK